MTLVNYYDNNLEGIRDSIISLRAVNTWEWCGKNMLTNLDRFDCFHCFPGACEDTMIFKKNKNKPMSIVFSGACSDAPGAIVRCIVSACSGCGPP